MNPSVQLRATPECSALAGGHRLREEPAQVGETCTLQPGNHLREGVVLRVGCQGSEAHGEGGRGGVEGVLGLEEP